VNYGAIGAVIGHEISHSFDDQGRKIDAKGAITDWWTRAGRRPLRSGGQSLRRAICKIRSRARIVHQSGLTMGENIADLAGLQVALVPITSRWAASRLR
jgi:putative endopeptidase